MTQKSKAVSVFDTYLSTDNTNFSSKLEHINIVSRLVVVSRMLLLGDFNLPTQGRVAA